MALALIVFVVSLVVAASALTDRLWGRFAATAPRLWESAAAIAVTSFVIAIALNWILSWLHLLNRVALLAAAAILLIGGLALHHRRGTFARPVTIPRRDRWVLLALSPLVLWIGFVMWRGSILPVLSHDALAYHMPKAVMLARANQYAFFEAPDPRIGTSPANYELLLADVLLLTGSDELTEWVGTAAYISLLLLAAATAERWWGRGFHIAVTVLLTAAVPVILLHAGAHKNDLLVNVFYLAALLWGSRWLVSREIAPLVMTLASLAAAGGTKLQAVFVAVALVAVTGWLVVRRSLRVPSAQLTIVALSFPVAVLFFGGWAYFANLLHTGQAAAPASASSDAGYGDWSNVLEVPLLLLMRPFDAGVLDIYVPWRAERWYWPRFELYFSHYGIVVTLLALAMPFAITRYARRGPAPIRRERVLASVSAAIALLLMLPVRIRPFGFFSGFPRYFLFVAVFVIAWTAAPVVRELALRRRRFFVQTLVLTGSLALVAVAVTYTINDSFQPWEYLRHVVRNPGERRPYFAAYRAGTIVDRAAGPSDVIAVHAGFDSWIYPMYGKELQRQVRFIGPADPIPPEARFVVVDRAWNIIWGEPRFTHMGQYQQYLAGGKPTDDDLAVVKRLFTDRETWVPIYRLRARNQAVFMRKEPAAQPQRADAPRAGS